MFRFLVFVFVLGVLIVSSNSSVSAQQSSGEISVELQTVLKSGSNVPFWLWANKRGKVNGASDNLIFDINYIAPKTEVGAFTFTGGIDLTSNIAAKNSVNFSQAYVGAKFKGFKLTAGRYYRQQAFADSPLGLGSMVIGRHASAMPGIEFGTDNFISIPFTHNYVKYKFNIGHFWFEKDRYIDDAYLHSKDFYLQIDLGRLKLSAGIIHNVMWGGTTPSGQNLGSSFDDFLRVFAGRGAAEGYFSQGEVLTALGNVVASYDTGILWDSETARIEATRLFFLEDKSALLFRSAWDGQWTLDVEPRKTKVLKHFRYDYFFTIRQDAFANQPGGRANYYGHGIYRGGWTYQNKVLGVPLITLDFADNKVNNTVNNMIVAQSISTKIELMKGFTATGSFLYSRNYGVCRDLRNPAGQGCAGSIEKDIPLPGIVQRHTVRKDHYLMATEFDYDLPQIEGIRIKIAVGIDIKEEQKTNYGLTVGLKYTPNLLH